MQAVSSRPDVIPPGYLSELEKLQDQIPPFPDEDAYALISTEMGAPARITFSDLSASPIAAASLGQVSHSFLVASKLGFGICAARLLFESAFVRRVHSS